MHCLHLLLALGRVGRQALIDEIVVAGQLTQAVLAAKLVEARHAVLAIANEVERGDVDLPGGRVEARQLDVLQELRMVVQGQQAQALAAHAEPPIGQAAGVHGIGRLAFEGLDHRDLFDDLVGVLHLAVLDQVGHQRVQAVDGDELLGEIEGRAEVVHAAVDVVGIGDVVVRRRCCRGRRCRGRRRRRNTTASPSWRWSRSRSHVPQRQTGLWRASGSPVPIRPFQLAFMPLYSGSS